MNDVIHFAMLDWLTFVHSNLIVVHDVLYVPRCTRSKGDKVRTGD